MKKVSLAIFIALILSLFTAVSFADTSTSENSELWEKLKSYLKIGIDYDMYDSFDVGASGGDSSVIVFGFDFRSGNQHVRIVVDDACFMVSTYNEGDIAPLIAFYKLLPLFPEISAELPTGYTLKYTVSLGDFHAGSHYVEITATNYNLFVK